MTGFQTFATAISSLVLAVPGVSAIGAALGAIGGALAAISAPAWAGIAIGVGLVAAAGAMLWKYWDRVSSVVGGFVGRLADLASQIPGVQPTIDLLSTAVRSIGDAFDWAKQKLSDFAGWIGSFFTREVLSDDQKAAWSQAGSDAADAMIQSIKDAFGKLLDWFKALPGRIKDAIGSIDLSGMIKMPSLSGWWGGSASSPAAANDNSGSSDPAVTGHRARGGGVWPGGSFLVGENEPEIFTPKSGGTITPASRASGRKVSFGDIHVYGMADPAKAADEIMRRIERKMGSEMRGAHADTGAWD